MVDFNVERKLFVPGPVPSGRIVLPGGRGIAGSFKDNTFTSKGGWSKSKTDLAKAGARWVVDNPEAAKAAASKVKDIATNVFKGGNGSMNDPSTARVPSAMGGLSNAPNPMPVSLDSGIKPNTYVTSYLEAEENECSPCHLSSIKLAFPDAASQKLFDFFNEVLAFDIQTRAQANVSFNLDIASQFTPADILETMNVILNSLSIYYYYDSIISYHSNALNNNEGMVYLRQGITTEMLDDLSQLKRKLMNVPIPPNMYEFVRYLFSTYMSSTNNQSPIIKICPFNLANTAQSASSITSAISDLTLSNGVNVSRVLSLLRRAIPQWYNRQMESVPDVGLYDPNFNSIFANLPFESYDVALTQFPTVATEGIDFKYNSYTNYLDGAAFALTGCYVTANAAWAPGLVTPMASGTAGFRTSRRSYYEVGGTKNFYDVKAYDQLRYNRGETYVIESTGSTVTGFHIYGTDRCLSVNNNTVRETCYKVMEWLLSLDTIANTNKQGNVGRSRGRQRRNGK